MIMELIKDNPKITRNELSEKLNITADGVKYNIKKLIDNNLIERIGPDNGGYWDIK
jgi:ATP-dependent DNA helicase RecG